MQVIAAAHPNRIGWTAQLAKFAREIGGCAANVTARGITNRLRRIARKIDRAQGAGRRERAAIGNRGGRKQRQHES